MGNYTLIDYKNDVISLGLLETWKKVFHIVRNKENYDKTIFTSDNFGELYEIGLEMLDKQSKKEHGKYYTPNDVAKVMSEWLVPLKDSNVCDVCSMIDVVVLDITERYYNSIEVIKEIRNCKTCDLCHYVHYNKRKTHNVTENIFIVGFPFGYKTTCIDGYYAIWSNGTIASEYEKELVVLIDALSKNGVYSKLEAFLIDANTYKGQSGSPVLANTTIEATELLGVYSGRADEKSSLGYVWKTKLIDEIIEQNIISKT